MTRGRKPSSFRWRRPDRARLILVIGSYLGFTKDIPFTTPYQINASSSRRTRSARARRSASPASTSARSRRSSAQEGCDRRRREDADPRPGPADPQGRDGEDPPAHLPRGQLLRRPQAGHAERRRSSDDGDTIKITSTATPVQLDEVLTALQSDSRQDLKDLLDGLSTALTSKPTAAENRDADPSTRGETAAVLQPRLRRHRPPPSATPRSSTRRSWAPSRHATCRA